MQQSLNEIQHTQTTTRACTLDLFAPIAVATILSYMELLSQIYTESNATNLLQDLKQKSSFIKKNVRQFI